MAMAKAAEADRVAELEGEVADLTHRLVLLELFVDSEHRERMGTTLDEVRAEWRKSRAQASPEGRVKRVT